MDLFSDKMAERRKAKGFTQQHIADALGVSRAAVGQWESALKTPATENLIKLCRLLDLDPSNLIFDRIVQDKVYPLRSEEAYSSNSERHGSVSNHLLSSDARINSESNIRLAPDAPMEALSAQLYLPLDVPVLGVSMGGDGHDFQFNGETVDYVRRPLGIAKAKRAYATYVVGESMVPAFREGAVLFVNPDKPPSIGDDVVIELHPVREGEPGPGYIKRLKKRSPSKIIVEQFNPAMDLEFDIADVKAIHRVVPWNELLGI